MAGGNLSDSTAGSSSVSDRAQPKALLLIQALDSTGAANIALTYPRVTPLEEVQADMNELSRRAGWLVSNPQISTNASATPDRPSMTSVDFSVANAIPQGSGILPIEPLITGLKRFPSISIVFVMRTDFQFRGPRDFGNKYVSIRFRPTGQTYTYEVQVKDSGFESLGLPTTVEPGQLQPGTEPTGKPGKLLLPLIIALAASVTVWFVTHLARAKRPT